MKYVVTQAPYLEEADILVRVYENQQEDANEKEQCVGEILFRPKLHREHIRFTAWLPRGLVEAIKEHFATIQGDYTVQIANELPDTIGILTSCRENFDARLRNEFLALNDKAQFREERV